MAALPEEAQAEALRTLAEVSLRRTEITTRLDRELREASLVAVRAGANRSRIRALAGISSKTLYGWLAEEGIEVRAKAPAARKTEGEA